MKVRTELKYLRMAPRKVRLVAELIKRKKTEEAQVILDFAVKRGAKPILKLLNSAIASAKNDFQLDPSNLYISRITVNEGPKYKRWRPRSRGMASSIQKKTSHVTIILDEIVKGKKIKKAKPAVAPSDAAMAGEKEIKEAMPEKPKFKPELEEPKPKVEKGLKGLRRIFRRKSF
ncbi:50S ribosomal protein L22 [Parcubacteria bacterium DG_72]|nr:MAG: 50S ribosomal protein L22 [Parcubacteria bacterium DG_72]